MTQTSPLRDLLNLGYSILSAKHTCLETANRLAQQMQAQLLELAQSILELVQNTLELTDEEWTALEPEVITDTPNAYLEPPFVVVALHYCNHRCFVHVPLAWRDNEATRNLTLHYYAWNTTAYPCTRNELALWLAIQETADVNTNAVQSSQSSESGAMFGTDIDADGQGAYPFRTRLI